MIDPQLSQLMRRYKFSYVKPSRGGELWEHGRELRFHTRMIDQDMPVYQCEMIVPGKFELLDFILPKGTRADGVKLFKNGDRFIVAEHAGTINELEQIVVRAANLAAVVAGTGDELLAKINAGTITVPEIQYSEDQIDSDCLGLLARRLQQVRVIQVQADLWTIGAYLFHLGARPMFEIKPFLLIGSERSKLIEMLELVSKLHGCLLLVNMEILQKDEQTHRAVLVFFNRLNMDPEYTGGRIIAYYGTDARLEDNPLPTVSLPDIYKRKFEPRLKEVGLQAKPSVISSLAAHLNNLMPVDQALGEVFDEFRLRREGVDTAHEVSLTPQFYPQKRCESSVIGHLHQQAQQLLGEHLVGHDEIKSEILRTLLSYHILGISKPLVLSFAGPSGVGKNHLALIIAHIMHLFFQTPQPNYVSFNAASLVSRWGIYQLTGVQAGLKGMDSPGLLEKLTLGSVLSVDELDKTNPDAGIQDFLLDLLESGCFRNGRGQHRSLPRSVIILTLNAGTNELYEKISKIGFRNHTEPAEVKSYYQRFTEKHLLPALRGRIDKSFFFSYLPKDKLIEVGFRELKKHRENLAEIGIPWPIKDNQTAVCELAANLDIRLGARGMIKAVENLTSSVFEKLCEKENMDQNIRKKQKKKADTNCQSRLEKMKTMATQVTD
ncbi:MAG: AAA family ATPase [Proteobacteria bacterium]|nr:AAA family ATPase [Pseudomonadota bacterium]